MILNEWDTIDFTGIDEIDQIKKQLVGLIVAFDNELSLEALDEEIIAFIDEVLLHAQKLFDLENQLMEKSEYLLIQYHKQSHAAKIIYLNDFKVRLSDKSMDEPKIKIKDFFTYWIENHIKLEDLQFNDFYHNRDLFTGKIFNGSRCEVFTLNNHLVGEGKIKKHEEQKLYIKNKGKEIIPIDTQQILKIIIYNNKNEFILLFGRVYFYDVKALVIFKPRILSLNDKRDSVRATVFLGARVYHNGIQRTVNILDISSSGLLFEEYNFLNLKGKILLKLEIENEDMAIPCEVVRSFKQGDFSMKYGCKFLFTSHWQEEFIAKLLIKKLANKRKAIK